MRNVAAASSYVTLLQQHDGLLGRVQPVGQVVARLRRGDAEADRRSGAEDDHGARTDQRHPASPLRLAHHTGDEEHEDDGTADHRRRPEVGVELGPRQDVDEQPDGHGEDVGAFPAGEPDPERGADGEGGEGHEHRVCGDGQRHPGTDGGDPPRRACADEDDDGRADGEEHGVDDRGAGRRRRGQRRRRSRRAGPR